MVGLQLQIPYISIKARKIIHYSRYATPSSHRHKHNPYSSVSPEEKKTRAARLRANRLRNACYLLCDTATEKKIFNRKFNSHFIYKVGFVTLTIPGMQKHTDDEFHYQVFAPFMRRLKSLLPSLLYVWRAETQANGNLHYHLLVNKFIHHKDLRNLWNSYCYRAGYTDHDNPNSTDIHSLKEVRDEAAYIAKYITKEDQSRRNPTIKTWDCSNEIKAVKPIIIEIPPQILYKDCNALEAKYHAVRHHDFCSIQYIKPHMLEPGTDLHELYQQLLNQISINLEPDKKLFV